MEYKKREMRVIHEYDTFTKEVIIINVSLLILILKKLSDEINNYLFIFRHFQKLHPIKCSI